MTSLPPAPSIDADGLRRYDGWRRQWRAGGQSQAIAVLRHHGMARALEITEPPPPPPPAPAPSGPPPEPSPLSECAAVAREAVRMVHELLIHETGERQHA
ncbi:MAG: hypothetical protein F4206_03455 [Gammaproteobacteria bacterium]|nr:hypothetical protein [Gammaproteobacteria bacterium]